MRALSGPGRACAAALLCSLAALAAFAQEETPVNPDALGVSASRLPLQINGFAVGQYAYDFASDENSFDASSLNVSLFKAVSDRVSFFGQLAVHVEDETEFVGAGSEALRREGRRSRIGRLAAQEGGEASVETEIDNLQVAWAASPRHGLQLVFGKFDSPLTLERDDAPLNLEATNSFLFEFAQPVKFTGLMARQTFSPKFEAYAILSNGWDVSSDNNKAKTGAVYGVWSPIPIAHFGLGAIYGAEKDGRTGDPRATGIFTVQVQQTDSWLWGEEIVYGREPNFGEDGGAARWLADEFFTHHRFGKSWALTARVEYFDDMEGSRTGRRQILRSFTLSPQYLVGSGFFGLFRTLDRSTLRIPELTLRLDLRYDRSSEPVFPGPSGEGRRDRFSTTLQAVYVF